MAVGLTRRQDQRLRPRGVHFPFMKRSDGIPSADSPPDIYISNIKQIIMTLLGERVMRPTFGCALRRLLVIPVTPSLASLIKQAIQSAVTLWEPRVSITNIDVGLNGSRVTVQVSFLSPVGQGQLAFTMENS